MFLLHLRKIDYIIRNVYFLEFLFSLLKGIYNLCAIHTQVKRQASVARIFFAGFFGIFSTSINKTLLDAQIKEYNSKLSTTPNTYDESRNDPNTTPTTPQLQNLNQNYPLSLVPPNFRNIALTDLITSRSNYPQSPIQHIITQQPNMEDTYNQSIEQPHITNFHSQNSQVGSLHPSFSHPANLQNNLLIIPLFAFPHLSHLIITLHPAWNQRIIPTPHYITLSPNSTTPILKHPTNLTTVNPVHQHFPNLPFNPFISKSKLNPLPSLSHFICYTHIFPFNR